MAWRTEDETIVDASYSVTLPATVRRAAGIEAGDTLRWRIDDAGNLSIDVVSQRYGAFSNLEPIDTDGETHAGRDHDRLADAHR